MVHGQAGYRDGGIVVVNERNIIQYIKGVCAALTSYSGKKNAQQHIFDIFAFAQARVLKETVKCDRETFDVTYEKLLAFQKSNRQTEMRNQATMVAQHIDLQPNERIDRATLVLPSNWMMMPPAEVRERLVRKGTIKPRASKADAVTVQRTAIINVRRSGTAEAGEKREREDTMEIPSWAEEA